MILFYLFSISVLFFDLRHQQMSCFVSVKRVWAYARLSVLARDDMDQFLI